MLIRGHVSANLTREAGPGYVFTDFLGQLWLWSMEETSTWEATMSNSAWGFGFVLVFRSGVNTTRWDLRLKMAWRLLWVRFGMVQSKRMVKLFSLMGLWKFFNLKDFCYDWSSWLCCSARDLGFLFRCYSFRWLLVFFFVVLREFVLLNRGVSLSSCYFLVLFFFFFPILFRRDVLRLARLFGCWGFFLAFEEQVGNARCISRSRRKFLRDAAVLVFHVRGYCFQDSGLVQ